MEDRDGVEGAPDAFWFGWGLFRVFFFEVSFEERGERKRARAKETFFSSLRFFPYLLRAST